MNKPRAFAIAAAIGVIAVIGGYVALLAAKTLEPHHVAIGNRPVWTEVRWPFPLDQFGRGKAFHCRAADCGTPLTLYVRAKIGFCNCTTGVADDAELERISDLELLGGKFSALRDGHPISVARMKGRSRSYALNAGSRPESSALVIAFNDRCDAIVATVVLKHDRPDITEPNVIAFLNGPTIMRWVEVTLGL